MADRLKTSPLFSAGYGVVPKAVMQDRELNITAKCLYAYFCSFAGVGDSCFPSRNKICYDLNISPHTFHKHLRELTEHGYIITEQIKEGGRFSHNVYTLSNSPCVNPPCAKIPCAKVSHTDSFAHDNTAYDNLPPKNNSNKNEQDKKEQGILKTTEGEKPPAREKPTKHKFGEYHHVMLTDEEHKKLIDDLGDSATAKYIRRVDVYCEKHNKSYPNCAATIRDWYEQDKSEPADKGGYDSGAGYTDIYAILGGKEK